MSSRTSSLVTTRLSKPLIMAAYCISGTSNQPQRRGRPVTDPNSLPRLRIWSPQESKASVGNGPPPTPPAAPRPPGPRPDFVAAVADRAAPGVQGFRGNRPAPPARDVGLGHAD